MINKFYVLILALLIYFQSSAQKISALSVDYKMFCDTELPLTFYTSLSIENNVSIYQEKYSTTQRWDEKYTEPDNVNFDRLRANDEPYLKTDAAQKKVLLYDKIGSHNFLIEDNFANFDWNISNETKELAGYKCVKATTSFRGREWVVWFTPDIPLSFGPWKFHGLPGLILESYDVTKRFHLVAVKIESKKSGLFDKDFTKLMKADNKTPITYKKFIMDKEEESLNRDRLLSSNLNIKIESQKTPRGGEELIYEWEK